MALDAGFYDSEKKLQSLSSDLYWEYCVSTGKERIKPEDNYGGYLYKFVFRIAL